VAHVGQLQGQAGGRREVAHVAAKPRRFAASTSRHSTRRASAAPWCPRRAGLRVQTAARRIPCRYRPTNHFVCTTASRSAHWQSAGFVDSCSAILSSISLASISFGFDLFGVERLPELEQPFESRKSFAAGLLRNSKRTRPG